jgi:hypothetical protein
MITSVRKCLFFENTDPGLCFISNDLFFLLQAQEKKLFLKTFELPTKPKTFFFVITDVPTILS